MALSTTQPAAEATRAAKILRSVRIGGRWYHPGDTAHLTDEQRTAYAWSLEGYGSDVPGYLPGQEPQAPTPLSSVLTGQAAEGDRLAEQQVQDAATGRQTTGGRGDDVTEETEAAGYETNEAAAKSTRPMTAARKPAAK